MSTSSRLPIQGAKLLAVTAIVVLALSGCGGGTTSPSASVSAALSANVLASPSAVASATSIASASPRPNGVFSTTGSMITPRSGSSTSTLLADGRVLATGGSDVPDAISAAEIYDPATGQWTKTGSMVKGHSYHTATLLKDGRVLIVGGCDTNTTAEMYDPATGKFSPLGKVALDYPCDSTATLLNDGRVLIAGGYGRDVDPASKLADLFDPATGKFTRTGSLHTARSHAQAVLLPDGRVLVIGGQQGVSAAGRSDEVDLASSEIYDPATGKFSDAAKMETPRTDFSATLLTSGKVLVAGGGDVNVAGFGLGSAELYDPTTDKFSPTGSMTHSRINPTESGEWTSLSTSPLADGRVLFVGGTGGAETTAEIYDPATGKFSATTSPSKDQIPYGLPAVTLKDGRVLMPGAPSLLYTP